MTNPYKPGDQLTVITPNQAVFGLRIGQVYVVQAVDPLHVYLGDSQQNSGRGFGYSYTRFNYACVAPQPQAPLDYLDITRQIVGR